MSCSKEEIERKRIAAVQKMQARRAMCNEISSTLECSSASKNNPFMQYRNSNFLSENTFFIDTTKPSYPSNSYKIGKTVSGHFKQIIPYYRDSKSKESNNDKSILHPKVISGTVYMISDSRFEVNPSGYSEQLISIFKQIPSKIYDGRTHLWNFSIDCYEELQSKVQILHPYVVLGTIPKYVLNLLKQPPDLDYNSIDLTPIEPSLKNKLMGFQRDGVSFGIAKKGRCLIADDMGLGKTFQALAIADYYKNDWPVLVATTSSMRGTWQNKILELLPTVPMACIVSLNSSKDCQFVSDTHTKIVIASYKMITTTTQLLREKKFGIVILDESHLLKSHKAQCTTALMAITKKAKRVILLSGTPALSRPKELFTQLSIIQPGFFGGFTEFGKRYCAGKQTNYGWNMDGQSNLIELQIILQKRFLIRRTKEQVLTHLQEKTREIVMLDASLLKISQEDQDNLTQIAQNYVTKKRATEKQAALILFFKETALLKKTAVCKYIMQMLKDDNVGKFLIFAHHKEVIDSVCCTLDENRTQYICIDGATKIEHRTSLVERFQCVESCRCAVLSITAANAGITLTAANLVLFAELHWNPGTLTQAESRAHRIGQSSGVCVKYLLAKGTADDYMWPKLQQKLDVLNDVGLSKDTFQDTTLTNQGNKNTMDNYLDKANFIPGTNIRKNDLQSLRSNTENLADEKSFLDDQEGDDILAELDF